MVNREIFIEFYVKNYFIPSSKYEFSFAVSPQEVPMLKAGYSFQ